MIRKTVALALGCLILAAVSAAGAEEVPDAVLRQLAREDKAVGECLAKIGPARLKKTLRARRISLKPGGGPDYLIEVADNPEGCMLCGARRCCRYVVGQVAGQYRLLLAECASDDIVVLDQVTNGYRDLKVVYPAGLNYAATYQMYAFSGKEYKEKGKARPLR